MIQKILVISMRQLRKLGLIASKSRRDHKWENYLRTGRCDQVSCEGVKLDPQRVEAFSGLILKESHVTECFEAI